MKLKIWLHIVAGFAVFNLAFGTTLFFYYPKVPFVTISPIIPQAVWACTFLLSGVIMTYGVLDKNIRLLWYLMLVGLFVKSSWEVGLLFRVFDGGAIIWTEMWGFLFYIQLLSVVYFNRNALI